MILHYHASHLYKQTNCKFFAQLSTMEGRKRIFIQIWSEWSEFLCAKWFQFAKESESLRDTCIHLHSSSKICCMVLSVCGVILKKKTQTNKQITNSSLNSNGVYIRTLWPNGLWKIRDWWE